MNNSKRASRDRPRLPEVAAFLRRIVRDMHPSTVPSDADGFWISHRGEGSLFFDADEAAAYEALVRSLMNGFAKKEDLSEGTLKQFLHDALFKTLDLAGTTSDSVDVRMRSALDTLHDRLKASAELYTCFIPIAGLALDGFRARFGTLRFAHFGPNEVRSIRSRRDPAAGGIAWQQTMKHLKGPELWKQPCAIVDIAARDAGAAEHLGKREVRRSLDMINFLSDLVPYSHGWLYMPGEATSGLQTTPVLKHDGELMLDHERLQPFLHFSWKKLRDAKHLRASFKSLSALARKDQRSEVETKLLAAIQWAGRATIEPRREESFLLYTISLETIVLAESEREELNYRLRVRTAHLLGKTAGAREALMKEVGDLYSTRSKIVHAGSYDVSDDKLGRIRAITKGVLLRLLRLRQLHGMNATQLAAWFQQKVLR